MMTALILIKNPHQARIIKSRLHTLHDDVQRCVNAYEAQGMFNRSSMLFICSQYNHLVPEVRLGRTSASPFIGISLLVDGNNYSNIGHSGTLSIPFSFNDIDHQYQKLQKPKQDFIAIPDVYTGPERRSAKQTRPFDRRCTDHPKEQRYKPVLNGNTIEWQQIPSRAFLQELKLLHVQFQNGAKNTALPKLQELLQRYNYPQHMVSQILGDHIKSRAHA